MGQWQGTEGWIELTLSTTSGISPESPPNLHRMKKRQAPHECGACLIWSGKVFATAYVPTSPYVPTLN
jgi:hypothetical protein